MLKPLKPHGDAENEPITLALARQHLRLDTAGSPPTHPDDDLVEALIAVAREAAEQYTGTAIASQTYTAALDSFPTDAISLGIWPVQSIDSVVYVDPDGVTRTMTGSGYALDAYSKPAQLNATDSWPQTKAQANAVLVTFVAGCTDGASPNNYPLPKAVKQAMLLMIGHLYENRESISSVQKYELPMGAISLLTPHRISMGA